MPDILPADSHAETVLVGGSPIDRSRRQGWRTRSVDRDGLIWSRIGDPAKGLWMLRDRTGLRGFRVGPLQQLLLLFGKHYPQTTRPFDWTFTHADLERLVAKITEREPPLALVAKRGKKSRGLLAA